MLDIELILRFFAIRDLRDRDDTRKQINLRKYLDIYMKGCDNASINRKRADFIQMVNFVYERFGAGAFTTASGREYDGTNRINPIVFEAISVASDNFLSMGRGDIALQDMTTRKEQLLVDEGFVNASRSRTTNIDNIRIRINRANRILFPELG